MDLSKLGTYETTSVLSAALLIRTANIIKRFKKDIPEGEYNIIADVIEKLVICLQLNGYIMPVSLTETEVHDEPKPVVKPKVSEEKPKTIKNNVYTLKRD